MLSIFQLTCTRMNEHIRILETGEINTGEGLFRFVAPEKIPFWQDFAQRTEIIRRVYEHGAVSLEVDANYDEYYTSRGGGWLGLNLWRILGHQS